MPHSRPSLRYGLIVLSCLTGVVSARADAPAVPLWGRWETALQVQGERTPPARTEVVVELTGPNGARREVEGFWNGGNTWLVRFMPDQQGTWRYRTRSKPELAGLDDQSGSFECSEAKPTNELGAHGPLRVVAGRTHLEHADGTPFFWLGDTAWNGPLLSQESDWDLYLKDRAAKHFTVIQFNAIAPWRTAPTDADGQTALVKSKEDGTVQINPRYFQRLDARFNAINAQGLVAAPVLLWANQAKDLGNTLSEEDATWLIRYQVARYGAHHVAWILAGDHPYKERERTERWKRIGRTVFGQEPHAPVTTHPTGMNWPWESWREETWLDFLGYQSGHGDHAPTLQWIHSGPAHANWRKAPRRPVLNLEPPYEDHKAYQSRKPHSAYNIRRAVYWSLLCAPPAGVTYGAQGIWSWQTEPGKEPLAHAGTGVARVWSEAMKLPGSQQMKHVIDLFTSLPWTDLRPAEDLLAAQPGTSDPGRFISSVATEAGDLALFYLPVGGTLSLKPRTTATAESVKASWFDPRTGKRTPAQADAPGHYNAPSQDDWVLVIQKDRA